VTPGHADVLLRALRIGLERSYEGARRVAGSAGPPERASSCGEGCFFHTPFSSSISSRRKPASPLPTFYPKSMDSRRSAKRIRVLLLATWDLLGGGSLYSTHQNSLPGRNTAGRFTDIDSGPLHILCCERPITWPSCRMLIPLVIISRSQRRICNAPSIGHEVDADALLLYPSRSYKLTERTSFVSYEPRLAPATDKQREKRPTACLDLRRGGRECEKLGDQC
jgi:hypothetical protein